MTAHREISWKRPAASVVIAVIFLALSASSARAQSCVVNATTDAGTGSGGSGDLRYCITQANAAIAPFSITFASFPGVQTINLNPVNGPLTLSNAAPGVTVSMQGPGANLLTISGGNAVQVFSISSGTVSISSLTIANGNAAQNSGGGISNLGALTVTNSTFSGNTAEYGGGIFSRGPLTVGNSTFSGNSSDYGGGINSQNGTLTVTNSTFFNNTSGSGGGIFSETTTTVTNSTFSGNSVTGPLGGGGGIFNLSTLTVGNSTFSGNSASYGGGIVNGKTLTLTNSIVAGNTTTAIPGDDCDSCGAQSAYNLISTYTAPINNPLLAPLGWYDGPMPTMLPLPGSAAIGQGSTSLVPAGLTADQRGFPRLTAGAVDLGAVQTHYLIVTNTSGGTDGTPDCNSTGSGAACSLADAVTLANTAPNTSGTDIAFASNVTPTITLTSALPAITGNLDLAGPGANLLTVSGGYSTAVGSVFAVNSGADVSMSGITISEGDGSNGGGIQNLGTLTVTNSTFSSNTGYLEGGGIYSFGTLTVTNSTFSVNSAFGGDGAGIYSSGTLTVTNSTFSGNFAATSGGGIYSTGMTTLTNSTLSMNQASSYGGIGSSGTMTVSNSILTGDVPDECGGNGCPNNGSSGNVVDELGGTSTQPSLAALGNYGGPTQTLLPLPGYGTPPGSGTNPSPAICAGSASLVPPGITTDQRGYSRVNTSYMGSACVDAGAVQTNYQSVQFATPDAVYTGAPGVAISNPADPVVLVIENAQSIGGVPVLLAISGSPTTSGLWTETTATPLSASVGSTGADFNNLLVTTPGGYTLSATLNITSSISISTTSSANGNATLDISSLATTTGITDSMVGSSTYGQRVTFTATITSGGAPVTSGTVTFTDTSTGGTLASNAALNGSGQATVTLSTLAAGNHIIQATYNPDSTHATSNITESFMVNPATLTYHATPASRTYGAANPALGGTVTGFASGDNLLNATTGTLAFTTTATSASGVGSYAINGSGLSAANYTFAQATGNATALGITAATLTITAGSTGMTYGGTPPAVTPLYSAFAGMDTAASLTTAPTCVTTATSSTPAGMDAGANTCSGAVDGNYNFVYLPGNVTIRAASLTITASSGTMTYGGTPPTVTPVYGAFAGTDTAASLTTAPVCVTSATSSTPAGTDAGANTCSGAVDANYTFNYVAGNVTVSQATPKVTLGSSLNPVLWQNPITLTATVSSLVGSPSGTVSFYDGNTLLASGVTLVGGQATYITSSLAIASHPLTALYSGDTDFASLSSAVLLQTVEDFNFSMAPGASTSASAFPGGTASYTFQLGPTSSSTFPSAVSFSVKGLPTGATATFTPATLQAGSGSTTVTLAIQLANQIASSNAAHSVGRGLALAMMGGAFLLPFGARRRRPGKKAVGLAGLLLLLVVLTCIAFGLTACGGGGSGVFGQQVQSYTVTITGASGSLTHKTTVNLTVE